MGAPTVNLEKLDAFEPELALRAHMGAGAGTQPMQRCPPVLPYTVLCLIIGLNKEDACMQQEAPH